jgi:predicted nuclease with TOPRIM domain
MIRVQQIADLEARVLRAIDLIERLRTENRTLSASLDSAEQRSRELEGMLDNLRGDQQNVEQIILRTLNKLDGLEDAWAEMQQEDPAPADRTATPPDPPPSPPGSGAAGTDQGSLGGRDPLGAGAP